MQRKRSLAIVLAVTLLAIQSGGAAELRLRAECECDGAVVTLGDVAEVLSADALAAETLAGVELFPAPLAPRQRFVRVREIQEVLLRRGIDLREHQFTGCGRITVLGWGAATEARQEPSAPAAVTASAERRAAEATVQYLQAHVSSDVPWTVEVGIDPSQASVVADSSRAVSISGGTAPWTGPQRFELTVEGPQGPKGIVLEAEVGISPSVVVATRSLLRGTVIRPGDVELQSENAEDQRSDTFDSIDEVIGKETTRTIAEGRTIEQTSIRSPLLVRRGDVVTVYARSPGIFIRTMGRARDDGSLGELVAVESLEDRSTYYAQVSEVREVEVYARAAKAEEMAVGGLLPIAKE